MRILAPRSRLRVLLLAVTLLAIIPTAANAAPKKAFFRLSASAYSVSEGNGTVTVTVVRSGNTSVGASVDYGSSDGATGVPPAATAHAGVQYGATSGTLNFAAGQTRRTFTVPIIDNPNFDPPNKKFTVTISNPNVDTGSTQLKPPSKAVVTILDNDGPGTIDLSSSTYSVVEGAGVATITATRDGAPNITESVDYATSDGTAVAGSDYETTTGTITFGPNEMSKTFQVPIDDDNVFEGADETLDIILSNPQNVSDPILGDPVIGPNSPATLTIVDDDIPTFSFSSPTYSVNENEASGVKTITVNRGGDVNVDADVSYSVDPDPSVTTATGGGTDYTLANGTLHFAAGETSKTFDVAIHDDSDVEGNETIGLRLTVSGNPTPVDTALLSIVDDDATSPSVQFSNVAYSVSEAALTATVTVTLSEPAVGGEHVDYTTADAGSSPATGVASLPAPADGNADYRTTSGTLNFSAGQQTKTIDIPLNPDTVIEDDETFTVTLSNLHNLQAGDPGQATVTILDDDSAGTLEFSALRYDTTETSGNATITVRRVGGSGGTASVDYATSDGTATAPADYQATSGTLNFADGETQKTFSVPVAWDGRAEGDETVSLALTNFTGDDDPDVTKAAVLHIADDGASGPVQFSAASYDVAETAGSATITVNRSGGSLGGPVTVDYAGTDGTRGTLTFAAGETSKAFQVPVVDDNVHTGTRTVGLTLSNPGGGTSVGGQATAALNIADDEPASSPSKDKAAPKLKITAKKLQKALKAKKLVFKVRSNEVASLKITLKLRKGKAAKRKVVVVRRASKRVAAGKTVTVTLKLNKQALSKLTNALVKGKVKVTLSVKGTDAARNSATVNKAITLK